MIRLWIGKDERWNFDCIRRRYKNYLEFMFWGCFTYDYKGPCHIYSPELAQDKKIAQEKLDAMNKTIEEKKRVEFESLQYMQKLLGTRTRLCSFEAY